MLFFMLNIYNVKVDQAIIRWALLPAPPTVLLYPQNLLLCPYLTYRSKWVKSG